jgi:hypothetical protein
MAQDNVHDRGPLGADLAPPAAAAVPEPDPVVFQLDELLVKLKQLFGTQVPFGEQLLFSMGEYLFSVTHGGLKH